MSYTLPHIFQDNVNETASGVQINENFSVTKAQVEALEALIPSGPNQARVARSLATPYTPNGTKKTLVTVDVELPRGSALQFKSGGVVVAEVFNAEANGGGHRASTSFLVPAAASWEAVTSISGVGGPPVGLFSSYCPF